MEKNCSGEESLLDSQKAQQYLTMPAGQKTQGQKGGDILLR